MTTQKTVVLVQPPIEDFYLTGKRTIPYGLASIAAAIRKKGYQVFIVDGLAVGKTKKIPLPDLFRCLEPFYSQKDITLFSLFHPYYHFGYSCQHIANLVRSKTPFLVGISSLFTAYRDQVLQTAKAIKQFLPGCPIVIGGHHPTVFPKDMLHHKEIDFILRGEAEDSMPLLCDALENGSQIKDVPGIAFKDGDDFFVREPEFLPHLESLPLPAFDLLDHQFYRRNKRESIVVVSSRGCPMPCSYCSVSATSGHAPYRLRPVLDVIREIKTQLESSDIGFIDFEDENLCFKKEWFLDLFSQLEPLLKDRNIELRAMNGLFPGSLDVQTVKTLKQAGFKTLNLSLGSSDKQQLKRFHRPDVRASFENALNIAGQMELDTVSYLIASAPNQTAQSSLDDLLYLAGKKTLIGLSVFYPAPGSKDYEFCRKNLLLPQDFTLMRSSALPISHTTTRVQAVTLWRLSRIINFLKFLIDQSALGDVKKLYTDPKNKSLFTKRLDVSIQLLCDFFKTGIIKGASPSGTFFEHVCDTQLTHQFLQSINTIPVMGIQSNHMVKPVVSFLDAL